MITIKRKELQLSCVDHEIPAQGSANIPVILENDNTYSDYFIELHCGYYLNTAYKQTIMKFKNNKYLIPAEAFNDNGPLYIAALLIKGDERIKTNKTNFTVNPAPSGTVILPVADEWHLLVKNYMDVLYDTDYSERFEEVQKNLEDMTDEAKLQQDRVTQQQNDLDDRMIGLGILEDRVNSNELLRQSGENKRENQEIKRETNTTAAIKKIDDKVNEVNTKLANGDFIGATGATPNISIGNVTVGTPNVTLRGTKENPILDMKMPSAGDLSGYYDKTETDEKFLKKTGGILEGAINFNSGYLKVSTRYGYKEFISILGGGNMLAIDGTTYDKLLLRSPTRPAYLNGNYTSTSDAKDIALLDDFTSLTDVVKKLFLLMHPVGCINMTVDGTNPGEIYGGTWELWGRGRVPVGVEQSDPDFRIVETKAGSKTHQHALSLYGEGAYDFNRAGLHYIPANATDGVSVQTYYTTSVVAMPPYITCYMWKRTA